MVQRVTMETVVCFHRLCNTLCVAAVHIIPVSWDSLHSLALSNRALLESLLDTLKDTPKA